MAEQTLTGRTVTRYRIMAKLGSGGMGGVYEGEDTKLGRRVAIKFLSDDLAEDPEMLERFQREARAASALNHHGICTVYEIDQHEGRHFIVMELLEGEPLDKELSRGAMPLARLLDLAIQLTDALEAAGERGIVHRDLKPANIWVSRQGRAKILDFGLAKMQATQAGPQTDADEATGMLPNELTSAGTIMGTVSYMSPEQARGLATDPRTDIFSLGTVLYRAASGVLPFKGESSAVVFEAILNRDPPPIAEVNPSQPAELNRILQKALEKDRGMRYQTATDFKTDLIRLRRDTESGSRQSLEFADSSPGGAGRPALTTVAVMYFENLSGVKEDEYFRDGVTEDIITELSKIKGLKLLSRPTVLPYRDRSVTATEVGRHLKASFVLAGSIRRGGNRLRITAQLVDTQTDSLLWSERYDREMADVFEVQEEIARKIAEALRITLSPQEDAAIAAKPTESAEAYDLYLRGRAYARRWTRQDLEFALQMFNDAVGLDPQFALAHAGKAGVCAGYHINFERAGSWLERAREAVEKAMALRPDLPETKVAQAWVLEGSGDHGGARRIIRSVIAQKRDTESAYYLLLRTLFSSGEYQEVVDIADVAIAAAGTDYNVFVPISNAMGALGQDAALKQLRERLVVTLQAHLRQVPEDARAHILLATAFAYLGRVEESSRESDLAMSLRPSDANIAYNAACAFCTLKKTTEALDALRKAKAAGWSDVAWTRRDPDLEILHGKPEFDALFPATQEP